MTRTARLVLAALGAIVLGVAYAVFAAGAVTAWGNGCIDGIRFPDEQSYDAYLETHPNAAIGVCTTTTTTTEATTSTSTPPTSTSTTTPPSSSTTAPPTTTVPSSSTVPDDTTPSSSSSVPSPTTTLPPSTTPSTPSTEPQPGEMCASSMNSDGATSSGCGQPSAATAPPTNPSRPADSATSSALPSTGPADAVPFAAAGLAALAGGAALVFVARRRRTQP